MAAQMRRTVQAHIQDLRNKFLGLVPIFLVATAISYMLRETIITALMRPLEGRTLIYLTPGGGFGFIFSVMMWCGAAVTMPFLLVQLYRFVAPALPSTAQRKSGRVLFGSVLLFISGAAFGYFVAIPGALAFLMGFAGDAVVAQLTAESYLSFVLLYTIGLGILFQLPLFLRIIDWIRPLKLRTLFGLERYVITASFIVAAVITPTTDIVNLLIIALPVVVMYQVGIVVIAWGKLRKTPKGQQEKSHQIVYVDNPPVVVSDQATEPLPSRPLVSKQSISRGQSIDGIRRYRPSR